MSVVTGVIRFDVCRLAAERGFINLMSIISSKRGEYDEEW